MLIAIAFAVYTFYVPLHLLSEPHDHIEAAPAAESAEAERSAPAGDHDSNHHAASDHDLVFASKLPTTPHLAVFAASQANELSIEQQPFAPVRPRATPQPTESPPKSCLSRGPPHPFANFAGRA